MFQTWPKLELFSCVNDFFFPIYLHDTGHVSEDALYVAIDEKGGWGRAVFLILWRQKH